MKNCYVIAAALISVFACHAQESNRGGKVVRTQPDGAVIYEAPGVESAEEIAAARNQVIVRQAAPTFLELNKSELEQRLADVDKKLLVAREEEDAERISVYEQEKQRVLDRIEAVRNEQ